MKMELWKITVAGTAIILALFYFLSVMPKRMLEVDRTVPSFPLMLAGETAATDIRDILIGKENLVYFGYLNCKSVCHGTLAKLKSTLTGREDLRLVFISLDPKNDSQKRFREYFREAAKQSVLIRMESTEQAFELARRFGIRAFPSEQSDDIDHSDSALWINSKGRIKGFFGEFNRWWNLESEDEFIRTIRNSQD
ncbi:SCO1/SenC [Leptospira inadai serovar Lyme str. 10]|uniref:SCO1/SenC n=2 Tax=Leptospira inadai serovar Lyme TaxID=293084 RepID=V6HEC7_9LEPT|nr:SCO family protein [Leptospira inadai]EQA37663.1 SCO1/SenC [Leptospira inadai serovar Lyme str. 10]PNV73591.1 SCO family protein [Leptospira inadai serovar Lyme]